VKTILRDIWNSIKRMVNAVTTISILLGALFGASKYIDWRVTQKLKDPNVLCELASRVRPSVVFDAEDKILADLGGLNYIDRVHVERTTNLMPVRIILTPKHFLAQAPLLTSLDAVELSGAEQPVRGPGITWVYNIGVFNMMADVPHMRFRIEIIP